MRHSLLFFAHLWVCIAHFVGPASAAPPAAARSDQSGLPGLVRTGWPVGAPGYIVAGTLGYGVTESQGPNDGAHHRLGANLAASLTPRGVPWLSLALRLDTRLDVHPDDGMGKHTLATGEPRVIARAGKALNESWQLGGEFTLRLPGEKAPSIAFDAMTTDWRMLSAYSRPGSAWSLLGAAGFRLDFSGNAAPPVDRLRSGDRLALGLSDSSALLAAVGVAYNLRPALSLFGEFSADMLVGKNAPALGKSPWRITAGARGPLGRGVMGEASMTISLSGRPGLAPTDPLVPVEPRFQLKTGVRWGRSLVRKSATTALPASTMTTLTTSSVAGQLLDDSGAPLSDAVITMDLPTGERREVVTDAQGRYRFTGVPLGSADLRSQAQGFDPQSWQVNVGSAPVRDAPRTLKPRTPGGVLRGLTRSYSSLPLSARIRVIGRRGNLVAKAKTDAEGRFEIALPPGPFTVKVSAAGFRSQRRKIHITDNSVTVLNVDLREQK